MVVLWNWTVVVLDDAGCLFLGDIQIKNGTMSQDRGLAQTAI